jgi:hypothetical protein
MTKEPSSSKTTNSLDEEDDDEEEEEKKEKICCVQNKLSSLASDRDDPLIEAPLKMQILLSSWTIAAKALSDFPD